MYHEVLGQLQERTHGRMLMIDRSSEDRRVRRLTRKYLGRSRRRFSRLEHRGSSRGETEIPLRVLGFAFADRYVIKLGTHGRLEVHVRPPQLCRFTRSHARLEYQYGNISERLRRCIEILRLELMSQHEFPVAFSP